MSPHHVYSPDSLSSLHDVAARRFLTEVGLPDDHLLFAATEPVVRTVRVDDSERHLLKLGQGGDYDEYCVDLQSGEIVSLNTEDSTVWHVNTSPSAFLSCLEEFAARFPYGDEETELEEREEMASRLAEALTEIDGTALREDLGFWHTVLGDVAIGDYVDD